MPHRLVVSYADGELVAGCGVPRFVRMLAAGLAVEHSVGRNRLHPAIYGQPWTGQNDQRLEADGFIATALRALCPPWRTGPREAWVIGRYWRPGHARRDEGELFVSTQRQLDANMAALREREGARPASR